MKSMKSMKNISEDITIMKWKLMTGVGLVTLG